MVSPLKAMLIVSSYTYISAASTKIELDCKIINVSQKTFDENYAEETSDHFLQGKTYCYGEMSTELIPFEGISTVIDPFQPYKKSPEKEEEAGFFDLSSDTFDVSKAAYYKKLVADMATPDCQLTTFIAPQHGFVEVSCPEKKGSKLHPILVSKGFYPVDGEPTKLVASLVSGTLFGEQAMMGGWVVDERQYSRDCKYGTLACAKAEFALNRNQVNVVLEYIKDIQKACEAGDRAHCSYHLIGRNCVDFVLDVAKVAEITDDVLKLVKLEDNPKKDILERSLFSLSDKAWKYAYAITGGEVNIVDPRAEKL